MAAIGKFDTGRKEVLIAALSKGMTIRAASALAHLSYETVYAWMRKGRAGEEPFASFLAELEQAEAECQQAALARVVAAGENDWKAAAWILERRHGFAIPKENWQEREARIDAATPADPSATLTPEEQLAAARSLPPHVLARALAEAKGEVDVDPDR